MKVKPKHTTWPEFVIIGICIIAILYFFVISPIVVPWIQHLISNAHPMLKAVPKTMMTLTSSNVHSILDYANQIGGFIATVIGIIVGLKSLKRNVKAKRTVK